METPDDMVFLDTETTGLDPDRHEVFEVAMISVDPDGRWVEREFWLPVDRLRDAEPTALRITRFYERMSEADGYEVDGVGVAYRADGAPWRIISERKAAEMMAIETANRCLVGLVPSFDEERLGLWLRKQGVVPAWDYHLLDVAVLLAGALHTLNRSVRDLGLSLGVDSKMFASHTALGDARYARACFEAVVGPW